MLKGSLHVMEQNMHQAMNDDLLVREMNCDQAHRFFHKTMEIS